MDDSHTTLKEAQEYVEQYAKSELGQLLHEVESTNWMYAKISFA